MNRNTKFWDRIAAKYSRRPVADQVSYEKKLEVTRGYFSPESEVFEFGCGTGSTAIAHAPFVKHILATDLSANMIDIARNKAAEAKVDNVSFECADIDEVSAEGKQYDVVLGLSILHLVADRDAVIAKVYDMVKPGGVFVSSTACLGNMLFLFRLILPIGRVLGFFPLVKVFSVEQLKESLVSAGFTIDHEWRPGKNKAVFLVAKKAAGIAT